jgi:hypothetical protein
MTDNIIPLRPRRLNDEPLAYAPGVVPFDRTNPAHIKAWNALFAFGLAEQRLRER